MICTAGATQVTDLSSPHWSAKLFWCVDILASIWPHGPCLLADRCFDVACAIYINSIHAMQWPDGGAWLALAWHLLDDLTHNSFLTRWSMNAQKTFFSEILECARFEAHGHAIANPTCLSRVTVLSLLFGDICVQANKMPEGPLFKAVGKGDVEASVLAIRASRKSQIISRQP